MKPKDTLTPKEFEVVRLVARGMEYQEIARVLGNSKNSIRDYVMAARNKVGIETTAGLAAWFARRYPTVPFERMGYLLACEAAIAVRQKANRLQAVKMKLRLGK